MARRKQVAVNEDQTTVIEEAAPPAYAEAGSGEVSATATAVPEIPEQEPPARQWRTNPFPVKTENLEGYKVQLQESRTAGQPWQMQIKFGTGARDDMPSDAVLDFIKSQRQTVQTREGEPKEVQMFHWNDADRAWAMKIDFDAPATSRDAAHRVFNEAVEMVAQERGVGRAR
jgi:hypothetical protein